MKRASIITSVPAPSILSLTRARPRDPTPDYWKSQGRNVTTIFTVWIRLSLSAIHFIVNSRIHPLCPLCCYPHQTPTDRMLVSKSMKERGRGIRESLKLNLIFPPPHSLPPRNRVDHFIRSVSYHFSQHFQSCLSTVFQTLDTFKRQYHCPSAWYVNSPPRLSSIRLSTTSFTIHFHVSKPTFLMHDSRRKSAGKGLVSPISGTDWVIRIYRRDTRFLSASDCRRYWIRFHKYYTVFFLSLSVTKVERCFLLSSTSPIVRWFDLLHDTGRASYAVSINSVRKFQRIKFNLFSEGGNDDNSFARNTGCNIIFRLLSPNRYTPHFHYSDRKSNFNWK